MDVAGETNLHRLLASLEPTLDDQSYGFVSLAGDALPEGVETLMRFEEAEGTTWILPLDAARRLALAAEYPCRRITLKVHSSLAAVGLLAEVTTRLAARGISVNPVSAFFHDHLFVPVDQAQQAVAALRELSEEARRLPGPP